MEPEVIAAIILAGVSLVTSLLSFLIGRKRLSQESEQRQADAAKLAAEAEKLRAETEELRKRSLEEERRTHKELLDGFLEPFSDLLKQNKMIYDKLLEGRGALEYHPDSLRKYFNSLKDNDKRKLYWHERIDRLRKNNHQILALIQQYGGRILTEKFRNACAEFRYHSEEWDDVWKAVKHTLIPLSKVKVFDSDSIPGEKILGEGDSLYANRFPEDLEQALEIELQKARLLATGANSK